MELWKTSTPPTPRLTALSVQILSQTGNWFNYIATLTVVSRLADGRGLPLSIVLIIHFLPSFIWFPVAGVVADRWAGVHVKSNRTPDACTSLGGSIITNCNTSCHLQESWQLCNYDLMAMHLDVV